MKSTDFVDSQSLRSDIPHFGPGDEVKVHVKVVEGNKICGLHGVNSLTAVVKGTLKDR